jgi:outer membrane protein OmpA-like peptidoglycan-associated protein
MFPVDNLKPEISNFCLANMNYVYKILIGCLIVSTEVFSQIDGEIVIHGRVIDITTKKGIRAHVSYKSLPTGSLTGRFNDSTYKFSIFGASRYELRVEEPGYIPTVTIVDPKYAGQTGEVVRNVVLIPQGQTIRLSHLIFLQGKSVIQSESFDELDEVVLMMRYNENLVIQLEGHTDNVGNTEKNMELSQDRVDEVKDYLVDKGISKSRVKTKAFGGSQPIAKDNTPEARNLNRRVEVRILSE